MTAEDNFLNYCGKHYEEIEQKIKMLCGRNGHQFNKDYLHSIILRCYKAVKKKGKLNDDSDYGIQSYIIVSYFNMVREEARSAKNAKRDLNYTSDNISSLYEQYYNENNDSSRVKIAKDLFLDFSTLYLITVVEKNFPPEDAYLFKIKHLANMTYRDVFNKTNIKGCRQRILDVKKWLQENVTKEELKNAFNKQFNDILPED